MKNKKILGMVMTGIIMANTMVPSMMAFADQFNVISIGANLNEEQKKSMLEYFNAKEGTYEKVTITNKQEKEALKGIVPEAQIGNKTISCAYVQPTKSGGINVKTANLTYVTASMISNALTTAGIYNANVVAAAPFQVSGTGALTGIMTSFEEATGKEISEEKKQLANEEIKVTGDIAANVGEVKAAAVINEVKAEVVQSGNQNQSQVANIINNVTNNYNITLTKGQEDDLNKLMQKISKQDYEKGAMQKTLDKMKGELNKLLQDQGELQGFFNNIKVYFNKFVNWVKGIFTKEDAGIVNETNNDSSIGKEAITTGNNDEVKDTKPSVDKGEGEKDSPIDIVNSEEENIKTDGQAKDETIDLEKFKNKIAKEALEFIKSSSEIKEEEKSNPNLQENIEKCINDTLNEKTVTEKLGIKGEEYNKAKVNFKIEKAKINDGINISLENILESKDVEGYLQITK